MDDADDATPGTTQGRNEGGGLDGARPKARAWMVLQAALWFAAGAGTASLIRLPMARRPALADAAERAAERLRVLELTPVQLSSLDRIRQEWRDAVLSEEQSYGDRLFAAAGDADLRIQALLTDAQRSKYRELSLQTSPK